CRSWLPYRPTVAFLDASCSFPDGVLVFSGILSGRRERLVSDWNQTPRLPSASQNKAWKDRSVRDVVTGAHRAAVASAVTRVEVLIDSFRRKQPFTHFLSFALNHPQVQQGFLRFREQVLERCGQDAGVDESIFQNPAKLHLTIGTLALLNEQEVTRASKLLQQCQDVIRDITEAKPLPVEVRGIEYMNDDPSMVDVLYAKVRVQDGSDKLQQIADRLVECFAAAGLMERERDRVKIHGTVMNTLFRKDPSAEDKSASARPGAKDREAFNAKNILQMFGEVYFGAFELNSVQLSQRFSTDDTGYYSSAGRVTFS
uniref:Activating signal cointegrator 1 complex subunit 1 n=1 Tax=Cyprinus carpio carpio TaxID=630221 RepID=A0A9J7YEQ3_CYPCA